ncbi:MULTISPECIES: DUF4097 family beta strand repeat-containing protein [unclassified Carboxylicivirga]|uniref:DUF4097 family beta strand repeat-containing protein n=1 Tax=Carboxylicivirga TaxID=1628153 RepID=UPI003D329E9D
MKKKMKILSAAMAFIALVFSAGIEAQEVIDQVDETFTNISAVEIEGSFCAVDIMGSSDREVQLSGEISGPSKYDVKIRHHIMGGTLRVWIDRPNSLRNVKGKLSLYVPKKTNIEVDNSSGSISVKDIVGAMVKLEASSGSIKAVNINSDISAEASSGSISLSEISGDARAATTSGGQRHEAIGGSLKVKSSSGSIKVSEVEGETDITSTSGSQSIHSIGSSLYTQASSGSIKISEVRGDVRGTTSSGGMSLSNVTGALNLASTSGSQRGSTIKLTGNSTFKSSSGSISMDLSNDKQELSFALKASSGSLNAKGSSGRKKLIIDGGPIKVTGTSSSGSQSYR